MQILSMVLSLSYMALDYPAPFLKNTAAHRSFPLRIVLLFLLTFLTILFYQVRLRLSALIFARGDVCVGVYGRRAETRILLFSFCAGAIVNERGELLVHSRALLRAGAAQGRVHAGSEGQQRAGRQGLMSAHAFAPGHGTRRSSVDWRQTGWSVWPTRPSSPSSPLSSSPSSPFLSTPNKSLTSRTSTILLTLLAFLQHPSPVFPVLFCCRSLLSQRACSASPPAS